MLQKTRKRIATILRRDRHGLLVACLFLVGCLFGPISGRDQAQAETRIPRTQIELNYTLAPIVEQVVPSVVNVYAKRFVAQRQRSLFDDPFFQQFFGDRFGSRQAPQRKRTQESLGSGVIVDAVGLVVTNHHVIENAEDLTVILADRREYKATIVLQDERTDLAVLQLRNPPADLVPLALRDSDDVAVGDLVLAVGNPFGVGQTVTSGIISALARTQVGVSDYQSFIQTDAAINPGNSGGALVGTDGRLIGVNTAIFSRSGGSVGIGFAIPANMVAQVIRAAQNGGEVIRPWTGAMLQTVSSDLAASFGLDRPQGALITFLHASSPLLKAGLRVGDVITAVDGQEVVNPEQLRYRIATRDVGALVKFDVVQNSQQKTLSVVLQAPPETPPRDEQSLTDMSIFSGLHVANLNPALADKLRLSLDRQGVIVLSVVARSAAARFGFRSGDVIRKLDDVDIKTVQELIDFRPRLRADTTLEIQRGERILKASLR